MTYTEYLYQTLSPEALLMWKVVGCLFVLYKLRVRVRHGMKSLLALFDKAETKFNKIVDGLSSLWGRFLRGFWGNNRRAVFAVLCWIVGVGVLAGALFFYWKTGNPFILLLALLSVGPIYYGFSLQQTGRQGE